MRLPLGTTGWNHSYYTGNPLSALHSLQQLQAGASSTSPVQMSASTRESHGAAPSSCVCCPQVTLSATHPQVQMDPPALSQVTLCQPRSLRLPRSSPLLHFWSVASLLMLLRRSRYQSPPHLWMPLRRLFHTSLSPRTFPRNSRPRSSLSDMSTRIIPQRSWLRLLRTMFSAPRVPDPSLRYFLTRLCRRLCTASHLTMPPHNYRLTEFFIGCILSNNPLDRQALPSAHCNAGSASPPQPPDIATLCSPSSASHASDGHEHTTAPRVLLTATTGSRKIHTAVRLTWYSC